MGGISGSKSSSSSQVAIPGDVAPLRSQFFNEFLLPLTQGIGGNVTQLANQFGTSLDLLNKMLTDPNFASTQFGTAEQAIRGTEEQLIGDVVLPQVAEAGQLTGTGLTSGSTGLRQIGQGAASVRSQLLPTALQVAGQPISAATDFLTFISNLLAGVTTQGQFAPVTGQSSGSSFGLSVGGALPGLGGGGTSSSP
jgi:hypothetical protein